MIACWKNYQRSQGRWSMRLIGYQRHQFKCPAAHSQFLLGKIRKSRIKNYGTMASFCSTKVALNLSKWLSILSRSCTTMVKDERCISTRKRRLKCQLKASAPKGTLLEQKGLNFFIWLSVNSLTIVIFVYKPFAQRLFFCSFQFFSHFHSLKRNAVVQISK